jgi:FAD/FMN-containing dehydrogenase
VLAPAWLSGWKAAAAATPLPPLPNFSEADALLLTPDDERFARYQAAFNRRTMQRPRLRALCKTPRAVSAMIEWLRTHDIPFALRGGGHCFEGFSQSDSVVVDTRLMNAIDIDTATETVTTGPGAALGAVYAAVGLQGYALPAGNCTTVGVAGQALGGGCGYLSRQFGFLCDSLKSIECIDANGRSVVADAAQNVDLFWACRGGGGGCFGVATKLRFQLFPLRKVLIFTIEWSLPPEKALTVVKEWQAFARQAPEAITSTLTIGADPKQHIWLECTGQSLGSEEQLRSELQGLLKLNRTLSEPRIKPMSYREAVSYLSEGESYPSVFYKGKSDILSNPLSDDGIAVLFEGVQTFPQDEFTAVLYPYGGAIARVSSSATAVPYRAAWGSLQYNLTWDRPDEAASQLTQLRSLYASMRPYVSGGAYVNYCDSELQNWREAYWGPNLSRLEEIKARFDPDDVFRHAQSV